jgi:hypothetical protein
MKTYGVVDVYIHVFLTSALVGDDRLHAPVALNPGKEPPPRALWVGDWVGPRTGKDDMEKRKFLTIPRLELRLLCRPTRKQSLY